MDITLKKLIEAFDAARVDDATCNQILTKLYGLNLPNLMNNLIAYSVEPLFTLSGDKDKDDARRLVVKTINIRIAGRIQTKGKDHEPRV